MAKMKLRRDLKIGDRIAIAEPIKNERAGWDEQLTVQKLVKKGEVIQGYGVAEHDGYYCTGTRVTHYEAMNGRSESCSCVLYGGEEFSSIEYPE